MKLDIRRRGFTSGLKKYSIDVLLLPCLFPVTRYLVSPYEQKFQFGIFETSNVLRYSQFSVYTHLVRIFVNRKIHGISLYDLFHSLWLKSLQKVDSMLEIQSALRWSNEVSKQLRVRRCNQIRKVVAKRKFKLAFIRVARRNWDKQQLENSER